MGRCALMRRPPKYVQAFIDRIGKPRFYFRRLGFKSVPLPGLPWSPQFMEAYQAALSGTPVQIGARKIKPGTISAAIISYFCDQSFFDSRTQYSEITSPYPRTFSRRARRQTYRLTPKAAHHYASQGEETFCRAPLAHSPPRFDEIFRGNWLSGGQRETAKRENGWLS
jgi:hypothetical protein